MRATFAGYKCCCSSAAFPIRAAGMKSPLIACLSRGLFDGGGSLGISCWKALATGGEAAFPSCPGGHAWLSAAAGACECACALNSTDAEGGGSEKESSLAEFDADSRTFGLLRRKLSWVLATTRTCSANYLEFTIPLNFGSGACVANHFLLSSDIIVAREGPRCPLPLLRITPGGRFAVA